ncbi:MAG: UDP-glucose 4-epimerase GalE [Acidobacteriaceae bacterium]
METLSDVEQLMKQNGGKYLLFEHGRPKMVVLDPGKYKQFLVTDPGKEKILVTGGAGYIGSHTVFELIERGHDVVVLDNLSSGYLRNVPCPLIVGDVADPLVLDHLFEEHKISAVIHFAGSIIVEESVLNPEKYFDNNLLASINLIKAMIRHGVKKIVYSSSAAVYGDPKYVPIDENHDCHPVNPYGETKLMFEKVLKWQEQAVGLSSVIFRYFNAAGACPEKNLGEAHPVETHLIPRLLKVANREEESVKVFGTDYPTLDGTAVRDFIHVKDLAAAHALAVDKLEAESGCFTYNLGTGVGHTVSQVVDAAMEATNKMIPIVTAQRRPGDPPILVADPKKARAELGFEPKYSTLAEIIKDAWAWHNLRFGSSVTVPKVKSANQE